MNPPATVYVVDDDPALRASLTSLLSSGGFVVEAYPSVEVFLDLYAPSTTGCMVIDVRLAGVGGVDLQRKLAERQINLPFVVVTGQREKRLAVQAVGRSDARGFREQSGGQFLLECIQQSLEQNESTRTRWTREDELTERFGRLTPRERQIVLLLAQGHRPKEIALLLNRSHKTIENHTARIMNKLGAGSRTELVRLVIRAGLIEA